MADDRASVTAETPLRLVRVCAPHFVAGFLTDGEVRRTAPVLKYMSGWEDARVRAYIASKGWKASIVPSLQPKVAG